MTQSLKTKEDMTKEMKEDKIRTEKNRTEINTTGKEVTRKDSVICMMKEEAQDMAEELYLKIAETLRMNI